MPETRSVRNLIIGGGLTGCVTAWILAQQGYAATLLEKTDDPFGANGSFEDELGNRFDYGKHCLDADRSEFTSNFFRHVQDGAVRRFPFRRGIVLRGHVIPYAAPIDEWPPALTRRMTFRPAEGPLRLGSPRERVAAVFGDWFADLIFDEALESYPTLAWRREHGEPERDLMNWIYPWFFPLTEAEGEPDVDRERGIHHIESRSYHHRVRHADGPEYALYPRENGFENWLRSTLEQARPAVDVELEAGDVECAFDRDRQRLRRVRARHVEYEPDRSFWCAPAPVLARQLDVSLPEGVPQVGLLGSFAFEDGLDPDYHEILLADPEHRMYRVSYPDSIAGASECRTLQVEFLQPRGSVEQDPDEWVADWRSSLEELGLLDPSNSTRNAHFQTVSRGWVTTEDINAFSAECRRVLEPYPTVVAPHLSAAPDNTSRTVPSIFETVYGSLLRD